VQIVKDYKIVRFLVTIVRVSCLEIRTVLFCKQLMTF